MRKAIWSLVAVGVLLVSGGQPAQARVIGRSTEISVGREVAAQVERYFSVDTDPVAVARVRQIGRRLAASAKDADFPFEFHVVDDATVNAFALPGGFIYVFRGLLQLVPNDDALAFVLAHEISHVTRRHATSQFEKNLFLSAGITAILAGTGGGFGGPAQLVQVLAGLSFTRSDERDADENGITLMTRAGYNPKAAVEAMELVKRAGGNGDSIPALLRSHPAPDSRIKKLSSLAEELLAKRTAERAQAQPLQAPPPVAPRKLDGLDAVEVAPCAWVPLTSGSRWVYRVKDGKTETGMAVRVLEALSAEPAGVYRVEYDLGRGVRSVRLIAPAGDRVLSRTEKGGAERWQVDAVFTAGEKVTLTGDTLQYAGLEKVVVPAGEFQAVKVERLGPDGKLEATLWYAQGVGLVKREAAGGSVQELTQFVIPKP